MFLLATTYLACAPSSSLGQTAPQTSCPGLNSLAAHEPQDTTSPEKSRPNVSGNSPSFKEELLPPTPANLLASRMALKAAKP